MAKVFVKIVGGGSVQEIEANSIKDVKSKLTLSGSYGAAVNRQKVTDDHLLSENDTVIFSENVKGAV